MWAVDGFDESLTVPVSQVNLPTAQTPDFLLGEALASLYIGLLRYRRGERLSAFHHIQRHAVDRVVELTAHLAKVEGVRAFQSYSVE